MAPFRPIPWTSQPKIPVGIDRSNSITKGLVFCAPMSPASGFVDLITGQRATKTGMVKVLGNRKGTYYNFGATDYLTFPTTPPSITYTTPFTISWMQDARATSGDSTLANINFGSGGESFAIYQSTGTATYYFTAGPRGGAFAHSWSGATGALTNNVVDIFVLTSLGGPGSTTAADWNLYRNGKLLTRGADTSFSSSTIASFKIGVLANNTTPFEGLIGNMHIWDRVITQAEISAWSSNPFITLAPAPVIYPEQAGGSSNITTTQTITGVARIQATTTKTETGISRIQKSVSQTETGISRIQKVVNQTETGLARITATTNRTITGVANISSGNITTTQTINGVARIQATTARTETGLARIQKTVNQTITGVANITTNVTTTQTITGVSRITATTNRTETGLARIQATTTRTITGVARISTGGVVTTPLTQYNVEIGSGISQSLTPVGNMLEIEIVTSAPTDPPTNGKGVVFLVSGGVVTIYVWSGSAWVAK